MADTHGFAGDAAKALRLEPLDEGVRFLTDQDLTILRDSEDLENLIRLRAWLTFVDRDKMPLATGFLALIGLVLAISPAWLTLVEDLPWWVYSVLGLAALILLGLAAGMYLAATGRNSENDRAAVWIYLLDRRIAQLDSRQVVNIVDSPGSNFHGTINLSLWGRTVSTATVES